IQRMLRDCFSGENAEHCGGTTYQWAIEELNLGPHAYQASVPIQIGDTNAPLINSCRGALKARPPAPRAANTNAIQRTDHACFALLFTGIAHPRRPAISHARPRFIHPSKE